VRRHRRLAAHAREHFLAPRSDHFAGAEATARARDAARRSLLAQVAIRQLGRVAHTVCTVWNRFFLGQFQPFLASCASWWRCLARRLAANC
jgi:hypothetical protein